MFQEVKDRVNIIDVCQAYGIDLNRAKKVKCPFHEEKTASFSVSENKQIWHCIGCGEGGDVISLVEKLFDLKPIDACKKINDDFNLGVTGKPNKKAIDQRKNMKAFKDWQEYTCHVLTEWHRKRFLEYQNTAYPEYLLDLLHADPVLFFKLYGHIAKPYYTDFYFELSLKTFEKVVLNW
ncbi:DNA primase [anaerobic digester metagenome]